MRTCCVLNALGAQPDVAADRAAEQERILQHDAEAAAQIGEVHLFHVDAIDADCAFLHVVKAQQQRDQRGLARAGVADHGDGFPGLDGEGDIAQHPVGIVALRPNAIAELCSARRPHASVAT